MMEVFETLEDEFDEYFDRITTPRRNPVFQNRTNYMETLDETDFRTRFRLTKEAVMFVYSMIEETISAPTERSAISNFESATFSNGLFIFGVAENRLIG
ncbi:unnamed protein product [Pieris macdunnoughi]|uniref:Uncharacterized protein n=1 Tax=Pieris macdunnoughi TaxID=345717 RepID=A0A821RWI1_9NEOP|nr:unnamed protein product [Pieris macdunnoughi]CAF4848228.1 unnamed protein product [Pieris macdunnoughi]